MIRRSFASLCFLLLASLPAGAIEIQQVTSPGGVKAWLVEDHSIPFTAFTLMFKGGASLDAPEKRGAINLMTATLEEGAGEMNSTQFAQKIEELGADVNFDVGDDALIVTARALTDNRDEVADVLKTALTTPRFDQEAIDRVRSQVELAIRSENTDPSSIAAKEMARQAWGDHPYGSSINGTLETVGKLTRDDLLDAKNRVLARDRVLVSAAGDITGAELGALLDKVLGDLPATGTAPLPQPAKLGLTGGTTVIDWDSPQTIVSFAQAGLPMSDPDYFSAYVANFILGGGGFSSRLMDEIREKRGLTYGVSTTLDNGLYGDLWRGGMASANDKVAEAVELTKTEWDRMAQGVTEKELDNAKTYLTGEYPLRFDGNSKISGILAGMQLVGLPADYVNTRNAKIEAVTADDVKRVAARMLHSPDLRFVLVGRPVGVAGASATTASDAAPAKEPEAATN
ncbi:M16 family metallopeptidase [Paracoccus aminophilus]|uniref:Peptidase M16 n=1 Tax=Paracoccus aminophilus JCM 7686 TaxID=1367847 RepID=S5YYM2_PARAH|nr:pitrilysin family protein [Paracoccus aminophilus]AGT10306.1 peptidase M16 [Paracoccus aminophilus JCM 7686]